uniref:Uncharacterized protein n=1 Tax=Haptolina brevifila TaxID=156173 RepID=A0A7S2JBZ5_9EUKA|mmetsp:Transcript_79247/g.157576  ORF Transcript_79247/g.157576 Transcript_79247/m.157576 type:complete len:276 (+) Transcript_79247:69-896(+)
MPRIIGKSVRVVDHAGLTIDELAGNVATVEDRISIALVKVSEPSSEPWLTLDYDEWMCVLKGRMVLLSDGEDLEVKAGQTVYIARGERFRPTFPDGETEYVPVCLPAFRPDRCIREEDEGSEVSAKLQKLHGGDKGKAKQPFDPPETLFHMCEATKWEAAKASGFAYYPPTYEADGYYTHATGVPSRLVETANHFYQDVSGDWVCLEMTRTALRQAGIFVRDEEALPVGDKQVGDTWSEWICPHIIGGIPPSVVHKEWKMTRDGKRFLGIEGVTS